MSMHRTLKCVCVQSLTISIVSDVAVVFVVVGGWENFLDEEVRLMRPEGSSH